MSKIENIPVSQLNNSLLFLKHNDSILLHITDGMDLNCTKQTADGNMYIFPEYIKTIFPAFVTHKIKYVSIIKRGTIGYEFIRWKYKQRLSELK